MGKKDSRPQTPRNAWKQWLEKMIKRLGSNVSKLSEVTKRNATKNQEWLRKLRDTPVTTALETAKKRLVALAARLKRYNSENEAHTINKLFSTDASKVYTRGAQTVSLGTQCPFAGLLVSLQLVSYFACKKILYLTHSGKPVNSET